MSSVGVNPPQTPVTAGSSGKALATVPIVRKMPGPPAPFVPTPLTDRGSSGDRLTDGTTTVKFEGSKVAIKGSYFMSQPSGDVASQGTGGGIVSSQTQGKTEWLAPGSMDVKADGKNIQLLGDAMGNNGGSPVNAATMKELQAAIGKHYARLLCDAICNHVDTGRGQSARAENEFLDGRREGTWTRQQDFALGDGTVCTPDLVSPTLGKIVELKLCPNEPFTPNQRTFQDELARGEHRPYRKKDFIKVTPTTCGCPGWEEEEE